MKYRVLTVNREFGSGGGRIAQTIAGWLSWKLLDRDIIDMHAISRAEFMRRAWADPTKGEIDYTRLADTELAGIARGRETLAVFGWKPYMHNPRLKRWLQPSRRI